jgi:hypothetical protein
MKGFLHTAFQNSRIYWIFLDVGNEQNYAAEGKLIQEVTNPSQKV